MLLLREKVSQELKLNIPTKCIWSYLKTKWNIDAADAVEHISFNTSKKNFNLPEEYEQLIGEEVEKLKKSREKCLNDEINKKKSFSNPSKTRSKSNSMSSLDSKDGLSENVVSSIVVSEDVTSTRRSLRINENLDEIEFENDLLNKKKSLRANNKPDDRNKSTNSKLSINKTLNQLIHNEHNEKVSNAISSRKRKGRNVSESSSDNSKQTRSYKNNLTNKTVTDSPRSVTPETISRKSNLRSSDKDLKSTAQTVNKSCLKYGHAVDFLPELIEHFKPTDKIEKQFSNLLDTKSIQSTGNMKNESHIKLKGKTRNRVTSDLLVTLQSPEIQSLGRRSCSNKS